MGPTRDLPKMPEGAGKGCSFGLGIMYIALTLRQELRSWYLITIRTSEKARSPDSQLAGDHQSTLGPCKAQRRASDYKVQGVENRAVPTSR